MGFIRDWWNGTTAGAPGDRSGSKTQQVWRSTFDPGSNPNIGKVGSSYYDKVRCNLLGTHLSLGHHTLWRNLALSVIQHLQYILAL